jgi:hypothetical protein
MSSAVCVGVCVSVCVCEFCVWLRAILGLVGVPRGQ